MSALLNKMKPRSRHLNSLCSLLLLLYTTRVTAGAAQFTSHIAVNTPARSFSHGVGDPVPSTGRRPFRRQPQRASYRSLRRPSLQSQGGGGYPRVKPTIPFDNEDIIHDNSLSQSPWQQNNYNSFMEMSIPVLPPSPYKVDSPDPESLWPEGLFLPPVRPYHFGSYGRRADTGEVLSESEPLDPYLLEGSEAVAAVKRSTAHGLLYFHDIPHIQSLLANQELRVQNQLEPHRIASIRHTWPYNRP